MGDPVRSGNVLHSSIFCSVFSLSLNELEGYPDQVDEAYWSELKKEQASRVCDEHFYKLVQVSGGFFCIA